MKSGPPLPPDDDALVAELRDLLARVDPIPEPVRIAARSAIGWRTLDAEEARRRSGIGSAAPPPARP